MTATLKLVVCMAIVTWLLIIVASLIRAKAWTLQGLLVAFGNREGVEDPVGLAGRAERTARNNLDNFVVFAAIALAAHAIGGANPRVDLGAQVYFWARIAYIPIYYAGVPYLRTVVYFVSVFGLGLMALAVL